MQTIISSLTTALQSQSETKAIFLSGSHANGLADDYSDIDMVAVANDGPSEGISGAFCAAVTQISPIVMIRDRKPIPSLINIITEDWTRIDLLILKPDQLGRYSNADLLPFFDPENLHATLPRPQQAKPDPRRLKFQIEEFIRIFGLLCLVLGRKEYLNGLAGLSHLRNIIVELMIEDTATPNRGGALHLNRLITDAQKEALAALPPALPERESLIETHLAYAMTFFPLARKLATDHSVAWPIEFETSTWLMLERTSGITRPNNV